MKGSVLIVVLLVVLVAIWYMLMAEEVEEGRFDGHVGIESYEVAELILERMTLKDPNSTSSKLFLENLTIFDCSRGKGEEYLNQSIPFSHFLNVDSLKDPSGLFPNTYPTESIVRQHLDTFGLQEEDLIVCYGQEGKKGVGRAYHILTTFGFDVRVINGDLTVWMDYGLPVLPGETEITGLDEEQNSTASVKESNSTVSNDSPKLPVLPFNPNTTVGIDKIYEIVLELDTETQLIDVRPHRQFTGEETADSSCKAGHIKGATNIPLKKLQEGHGTFKPTWQMLKLLKKHKIDSEKPIVLYCQTGMSASEAYLALKAAGIQTVKIYDGSWAEYSCVTEIPNEESA